MTYAEQRAAAFAKILKAIEQSEMPWELFGRRHSVTYHFATFQLHTTYYGGETGCFTLIHHGQELFHFGHSDGAKEIYNALKANKDKKEKNAIDSFLKNG